MHREATPPHRVTQAVILVGGKGTRLGELTTSTPKPLMPINDYFVLLDLLLTNLVRQGFSDILLLAGHFGEQIEKRFQNRKIMGAQIETLIEDLTLGTAGALKNAFSKLQDDFLVLNGDSHFEISFRDQENELRLNPSTEGVIALRNIADAQRHGNAELENGFIVSFEEKVNKRGQNDTLLNAGIYLLRKNTTWGNQFPKFIGKRHFPQACP